jgi:hypothetical protein
MIRGKRVGSLWPEPEVEDTGEWGTDTIFEEDARSRVGIRDRQGCTRWYGPIVVFVEFGPQLVDVNESVLQE